MDSTFFFGAFFVHAFGLYKTLTFDPEAGSLSYPLMSPRVQSAVPVHKTAPWDQNGIKDFWALLEGPVLQGPFGLYKTLTFDPEAGSLSYPLMSPRVQSAVPVHKTAPWDQNGIKDFWALLEGPVLQGPA